MARRIKAVQKDAIRRRQRAPEEYSPELVRDTGIMQGYQYVPPRMTWRDKWREIMKILRK